MHTCQPCKFMLLDTLFRNAGKLLDRNTISIISYAHTKLWLFCSFFVLLIWHLQSLNHSLDSPVSLTLSLYNGINYKGQVSTSYACAASYKLPAHMRGGVPLSRSRAPVPPTLRAVFHSAERSSDAGSAAGQRDATDFCGTVPRNVGRLPSMMHVPVAPPSAWQW